MLSYTATSNITNLKGYASQIAALLMRFRAEAAFVARRWGLRPRPAVGGLLYSSNTKHCKNIASK